MVTRLIFLFLLSPLFLFSAEFTASVSRNQINLDESFTLTLTLKDASTNETPSLDLLKRSFSIHSQQQLFNTSIVNGHFSSSTTWKFTLLPQREGELKIPAISIVTSDGLLTSAPIKIRVAKGSVAKGSNDSDTNDVILSTEVSNAKPYKNEPVVYKVKMIAKKDLANIKMEKIELENAIIEKNGDPKIYQKVIDGISVGIVEFEYLITPLKAGSLKIPSSVIQGVIPIRSKVHHRSFFDDDFDPFSMMQGYDQLKPFALSTEEIVLDVQPAIAGMNPWLPVRALQIEEIWNNSQLLKVGEPVTRGFKIEAEGIKSGQLPSLNDLHVSNDFFKIYADKPELVDAEKAGGIKSYRKEQYTIIPQQAGELTLPELSITWWDVSKKEKKIARIPARKLQVLPATANALTTIAQAEGVQDKMMAPPEAQEVLVQRDLVLYALIAGLVMLLCVVIAWGIMLQKKIMRMTKTREDIKREDNTEKIPRYNVPKKKPASSSKNEKLPDLNPT